MNSTSSIISTNNSAFSTIEPWFIPVDILGIICIISVIVLSTFFLFLIILDKTCHTISMLLVANSCLTEILLGIVILSMNVFTLENDLRQIAFQDFFCPFRGYLSFSLGALENYSYMLQSIYRYIIVVYPTHLFWQSLRTQILLIGLSWLFTFVFSLPFLLTGEILYDINNQICQIPLRLSFSVVFMAFCCYIIPISSIFFVYYKLVRYVHRMNRRVTPANAVARAKNELKMVRRTVILVIILLTIELPYALFVFISWFTTPPKYHFRIAWTFINISLMAVLFVRFQFTEPLRTSVKKIFNGRANAVIPALT